MMKYNSFLSDGHRLEPLDMSDELYKVAKMCWVAEPQQRPSFGNIYHIFDRMLYDQSPQPSLTN